MEEIIKIALVDDDKLVVQLLADFLNKESLFKVVMTCYNGQEFIQQHNNLNTHPDILILDLRMTNGNGLDVLEYLQKQENNPKTIVLSTFYKPSFIGQMLKLGVDAFLPKEIEKEELIEVIKRVKNKGHYFSIEQVNIMRKQLSLKSPKFHMPAKNGLTERELDVLQYICQQFTTNEIAGKLFVSPKTIETHRANLLLKTGVKNSAGLIIFAAQNNLINPAELVLLEA